MRKPLLRPVTDFQTGIVGRTWTAHDHPAVVVDECLIWMHDRLRGRFVSSYLRRLADKWEKIEDEAMAKGKKAA